MPTNTASRAKLPIMIAAWLLVAVIALIGSGLAGTTQAQANKRRQSLPSTLTANEARPAQSSPGQAPAAANPQTTGSVWANTEPRIPCHTRIANEAQRANEYPLGDVTTTHAE